MIASECTRDQMKPTYLEIKSQTRLPELYNLHPGQEDEVANRTGWLLATNPNTPSSILDHLSSFEDMPSMLERIAENPQTRPETLTKLSTHDNPRVRAAVAENSRIPENVMWRLANDLHPDVRMRLS